MSGYREEYLSTPLMDEEFDLSLDYPTAFGITFTPQLSGIILSLLGMVGMVYVGLTFLMPAWNEQQQLQGEAAAQQAQLAQQSSEELAAQLAQAEVQLQQAERRKATILELYANRQDIETILYNVNNLFTARDVRLVSFEPEGEPAVIGDDTLGVEVKNRLKRQTYQITMLGGFQETLGVIRDIERLQPLMLMRNLQSSLVKTNGGQEGETLTTPGQALDSLTTTLTLEVLLPLTPAEVAALAPPPPPEEDDSGEAESQ